MLLPILDAFLNFRFPSSLVKIQAVGIHFVKNILTLMRCQYQFGSAWLSITCRMPHHVGTSPSLLSFPTLLGLPSVSCCMIHSIVTSCCNIHQQSTVSAYVSTFTKLVNQLTTYSPSSDPLLFTTRFTDGLRYDIRAVVVMQQPKNLDTACRLALLQEEVASTPPKPYRSGDWSPSGVSQPAARVPLPLPPLPMVEKTNVAVTPPPATATSTDPTLKAVKAFRRAHGLCFNCGAKWSKDHQCSPEVLLAVEAIWQNFPDDDEGALAEEVNKVPMKNKFSWQSLTVSVHPIPSVCPALCSYRCQANLSSVYGCAS